MRVGYLFPGSGAVNLSWLTVLLATCPGLSQVAETTPIQLTLSSSLGQFIPPLVLVGSDKILLFLGLCKLPSGSLHPTYNFKDSLFANKPSSRGFNLTMLFVFC